MYIVQRGDSSPQEIFYISTVVAVHMLGVFSERNTKNNRGSGNGFEKNKRIT